MRAGRRSTPSLITIVLGASALVLLLALTGPLAALRGSAAGAVAAPGNDSSANPDVVHALPATIAGTTVGATTEAGEPQSGCGYGTTSSVWYSLRTASAQRIAIDLTAGGALEGTLDV